MSREIRQIWLERGATTLGERLNEKVKSILKEHRPEPLAEEKKAQLQEILEAAE
jgi:trimethylamine--corrinoid protein Co-methyltransferase